MDNVFKKAVLIASLFGITLFPKVASAQTQVEVVEAYNRANSTGVSPNDKAKYEALQKKAVDEFEELTKYMTKDSKSKLIAEAEGYVKKSANKSHVEDIMTKALTGNGSNTLTYSDHNNPQQAPIDPNGKLTSAYRSLTQDDKIELLAASKYQIQYGTPQEKAIFTQAASEINLDFVNRGKTADLVLAEQKAEDLAIASGYLQQAPAAAPYVPSTAPIEGKILPKAGKRGRPIDLNSRKYSKDALFAVQDGTRISLKNALCGEDFFLASDKAVGAVKIIGQGHVTIIPYDVNGNSLATLKFNNPYSTTYWQDDYSRKDSGFDVADAAKDGVRILDETINKGANFWKILGEEVLGKGNAADKATEILGRWRKGKNSNEQTRPAVDADFDGIIGKQGGFAPLPMLTPEQFIEKFGHPIASIDNANKRDNDTYKGLINGDYKFNDDQTAIVKVEEQGAEGNAANKEAAWANKFNKQEQNAQRMSFVDGLNNGGGGRGGGRYT